MKKLFEVLLVSILVCSFSPALAQPDTSQIRYIDFGNLPYFAWGSGIGIISPDSLYKLNIRFRMQNRVSVDMHHGAAEHLEARIRRLRLRFDGFILDPRFAYVIQLSFSNEDVQDFIRDNPPNVIRDAMFYYSPDRSWSFGFGQTKLPGNRERINSSGGLQLADRAAANSVFNIDRDFGFQGFYRSALSNDFQFAVKGAVTTGEGRNWVSSPGLYPCYSIRLELLPCGFFASGGDFFQGDLIGEEEPKLSLAGAYSFNNQAERAAGQRGQLLYENRDISSYFFDLLFKYRGLALMAEVMRRYAEDPVTFNPENPEEVIFVYNGLGITLQGSYIFASNFELIGRYSGVWADDVISSFVPEHSDYYTAGVSKYFRGHTFKFQFDVTYINSSLLNIRQIDDSWNFRFQVELGI